MEKCQRADRKHGNQRHEYRYGAMEQEGEHKSKTPRVISVGPLLANNSRMYYFLCFCIFNNETFPVTFLPGPVIPMLVEKYVKRFDYLQELIQRQSTGSPGELALKLGISRRTLFEYLNYLRDRGAPLAYSRKQKTYFYRFKWQFSGFL